MIVSRRAVSVTRYSTMYFYPVVTYILYASDVIRVARVNNVRFQGRLVLNAITWLIDSINARIDA